MRHLMRRVRLAVAVAGLWVAAVPASAAEPAEFAVKAAFLSKFGFYVEWPPAALGNGPLVLCVVGEDPFGNYLDEAVAGQQVGGRAIVVKRLKTASRESGCHIAYVGSEPRPGAVSESLRGSPTLVVTDSQSSSAAGGVIHFVLRDNRVRFTIDDDAAAQSGLGVSSKLLSLALAVKPRGSR
jgi:hypothetical protein